MRKTSEQIEPETQVLKAIERTSKPEQPGISSSVFLEVIPTSSQPAFMSLYVFFFDPPLVVVVKIMILVKFLGSNGHFFTYNIHKFFQRK